MIKAGTEMTTTYMELCQTEWCQHRTASDKG